MEGKGIEENYNTCYNTIRGFIVRSYGSVGIHVGLKKLYSVQWKLSDVMCIVC